MGQNANENRDKSKATDKVDLTEYKWGSVEDKDGVHSSLGRLVNGEYGDVTKYEHKDKIAGDRVTVIVSAPQKWGGSLSSHPGHCGIALWNSGTTPIKYQSFGILGDGTFADEEVNCAHDTIKIDKNFKIWYFTKLIKPAEYEKMQARMVELTGLTKGQVKYGKFFVARGWTEDSSYNCVTAVDTILVASNKAWGMGAQLSSPYAYAQTFTFAAWYISYGVGYKHM